VDRAQHWSTVDSRRCGCKGSPERLLPQWPVSVLSSTSSPSWAAILFRHDKNETKRRFIPNWNQSGRKNPKFYSTLGSYLVFNPETVGGGSPTSLCCLGSIKGSTHHDQLQDFELQTLASTPHYCHDNPLLLVPYQPVKKHPRRSQDWFCPSPPPENL
jgi:hypothetical protein